MQKLIFLIIWLLTVGAYAQMPNRGTRDIPIDSTAIIYLNSEGLSDTMSVIISKVEPLSLTEQDSLYKICLERGHALPGIVSMEDVYIPTQTIDYPDSTVETSGENGYTYQCARCGTYVHVPAKYYERVIWRREKQTKSLTVGVK